MRDFYFKRYLSRVFEEEVWWKNEEARGQIFPTICNRTGSLKRFAEDRLSTEKHRDRRQYIKADARLTILVESLTFLKL